MKLTHKSSLLLALITFGSVLTAGAETLTPDQALSRVMSSDNVPTKVKSMNESNSPKLVYTQNNSEQPTLYVFNNANNTGFMVLSADDVAPALLGYSDSTPFNNASVNPELAWWLKEYGNQIEWARNAGMPSSLQSAPATSSYPAVDPMTTTRWNQDAPFNDDCPEVNGTRCVTGCVATALSQVMKYHNWPAQGVGSNSYTSSTGQTLYVDFGNTTYNWNDMVDIYNSSSTTAQKEAVATLMYSAGVAVNMDYTTSESSATSFAAAQAMVNYFNYDKGIVFYSRDYYTISDWNELVYNQLKNYGPVQYSGQSNDGGHSFVCDGYSSDGYFHINWGWGGMSDGYFLLTALNPTSQGIGGSTSGYNFDQDIIGNVKPSDGTTTAIVPNFAAQQFVPSSNSVSLGDRVSFEGPVYSFSLANVSGQFGLKLTDANGKVTYVEGSTFSSMQPEYGAESYYVTMPANLAQGTYEVCPAVQSSNGNWYDIPVLVGSEQTKSVTVSDGIATFSVDAASTLSVSDVNVNTEFYIGAQYEMTATITNSGNQEYLGGIRLMLINSENQAVAEGDEYPVDLNAGESQDITYLSSWTVASGTTLSAGSYYICFVDANGDQLSDMQTITLNAQSTPQLSLSNFTITGGTSEVNKNEIEFTGTIESTSGYFGNTLTLVIFPYTSGSVSSVATYTTEPIFISSGQSKEFKLTVNFQNGTEGSTYFAMLYNGSQPEFDNQLEFTLSKNTTDGVDNISGNDKTPVKTEYFTTSGVAVNSGTTVAPGLYIVRQTMNDGTIITTKSMIR